MNSMTGFGSATRETPQGRIAVEARSVNSRFLEVNVRPPAAFQHLDQAIRRAAMKRLTRGKVDLTIRFEPAETFVPPVRVNARFVRTLLEALREAAPDAEAPRVESLLSVPGVLVGDGDARAGEELGEALLATLDEAFTRLLEERAREGEALRMILADHLSRLRESAVAVAATRGDVVTRYREKLLARIEELLGPRAATLDPGRLEQEVAIFADKADIAEECNRLAAHLDAFAAALEPGTPAEGVGRSLEFLGQEILREINTVGSKCRDLDIARHVLQLKQEIESVREQLANVE